jgi:hypothetical protein
MDEWIKKNGVLIRLKKKEMLPFGTTWMDLEDIFMLSEMSQPQKYSMISFLCRI